MFSLSSFETSDQTPSWLFSACALARTFGAAIPPAAGAPKVPGAVAAAARAVLRRSLRRRYWCGSGRSLSARSHLPCSTQ